MPDPYRILVTGSRYWDNATVIRDALLRVRRETDRPITVVHGACPKGVDDMAAWLVNRAPEAYQMTAEPHPAQGHPTENFGPWPGAGPRRNAHMVQLGADICLAFIGPCVKHNCRIPLPHGSHGATHCADLAEQTGITTRKYTA
ncbi:SLOG family protein [Streptomyces sp. NPDC055036]